MPSQSTGGSAPAVRRDTGGGSLEGPAHVRRGPAGPAGPAERGGSQGPFVPAVRGKTASVPENPAHIDRLLTRLPTRVLSWLHRKGILPGLPLKDDLREELAAADEAFADTLDELSSWIEVAGQIFDDRKQSDPVAQKLKDMADQLRATGSDAGMKPGGRLLRDHPAFCFTASLGTGYLLYRMLWRT